MKKVLAGLFLLPSLALAQQYAEVVRVVPNMVTIQQQQCRDVYVEHRRQENNAGSVLGAIAGAAIGNQFGGGSGKDIATVVGGVIGYNAGRGNDTGETYTEKRVKCEYVPVNMKQGDIVTFRYKGRLFTHTFD